jgi:hypothetical protein
MKAKWSDMKFCSDETDPFSSFVSDNYRFDST